MNMRHVTTILLPAALLAGGCAYEEGLLINNLQGTVTVPKALVTRTIIGDDGTILLDEPDPRLIGPVYLGLYPSVAPADVLERYPHPEIGPQYQTNVQGDAYPYGGTTIGDLRFACIEDLTCQMVSGRYVDWDAIIDWFKLIQLPLTDAGGIEIPDGEFLKQACYDILNVTSDAETRITAFEDRNDDGKINAGDLDFVEDGDNYVAEFTVWQQEHFWDQDANKDCEPGVDCPGFTLWGFMDAPSSVSYRFSTCDESSGFENREYNNEFSGGQPYNDVLNFPSTYISDGDLISAEPFRWDSIEDRPNLVLDFVVE